MIGDEEFAVLFAQPVDGAAPPGWTATSDGRAWTLPRETILEEELRQQPAPYPALVSVGLDDDGRTWLLDLEAMGVVGVAGSGAGVEDLVRFLVAELALNAWSEGTEVLLTGGFATEMVALNPARVRVVDAETAIRRGTRIARDAAETAQNMDMDLLDLRRDAVAVDSTGTVVIITPGQAGDELADAVRGHARSRVVVVHDERTPSIELTGDGKAFLPAWGVTIEPFGLPAEQGAAMADLMGTLRRTEDRPMPALEDASPVGRLITADGALREEFTEPRSANGGDPSSLLPEADEVYVAAAATTSEDLAALAPGVPAEVRSEVEALDPGLDDDLAAWRDATSRRPRVQVMGPVDVHAWGVPKEEIANLGGTIEFIVYLACQEQGVTPERAAVALEWSEATVHNRARDARRLLGERENGETWLPEATKSRTARRRGVASYELDPGVLVAADLFRRLRLRAQARGEDGLPDLVAALSLVSGRPFDQLRKRGYGWLRGRRAAGSLPVSRHRRRRPHRGGSLPGGRRHRHRPIRLRDRAQGGSGRGEAGAGPGGDRGSGAERHGRRDCRGGPRPRRRRPDRPHRSGHRATWLARRLRRQSADESPGGGWSRLGSAHGSPALVPPGRSEDQKAPR